MANTQQWRLYLHTTHRNITHRASLRTSLHITLRSLCSLHLPQSLTETDRPNKHLSPKETIAFVAIAQMPNYRKLWLYLHTTNRNIIHTSISTNKQKSNSPLTTVRYIPRKAPPKPTHNNNIHSHYSIHDRPYGRYLFPPTPPPHIPADFSTLCTHPIPLRYPVTPTTCVPVYLHCMVCVAFFGKGVKG